MHRVEHVASGTAGVTPLVLCPETKSVVKLHEALTICLVGLLVGPLTIQRGTTTIGFPRTAQNTCYVVARKVKSLRWGRRHAATINWLCLAVLEMQRAGTCHWSIARPRMTIPLAMATRPTQQAQRELPFGVGGFARRALEPF